MAALKGTNRQESNNDCDYWPNDKINSPVKDDGYDLSREELSREDFEFINPQTPYQIILAAVVIIATAVLLVVAIVHEYVK